jgi:hypothetical protein
MQLANLGLPDFVGALVGFTLTLMVFSYIFGDNLLFRLALNVFIGVAAGYAAVVAWYNVIWPQLMLPLISGSQAERLFALFPLILSGLLLLKLSTRLTHLGSVAIAYLVGVGVAAAIGGAVLGTLFPQVGASINLFDMQAASAAGGVSSLDRLARGSIILVGTLTSLIYFHYGARSRPGETSKRPEWLESLGWVGQVFIAITFGTLFAGVYSAALTALIERLHFLGDVIFSLVGLR